MLKSVLGFSFFAVITVSAWIAGPAFDAAAWAEAEAQSQIAAALLADNMHHMR